MSGEQKTEAQAEGIKRTERFKITLDDDGKAFLASLKPVTRDVWTRRIKKGRMTKEYSDLLHEMFDWWKKENKK